MLVKIFFYGLILFLAFWGYRYFSAPNHQLSVGQPAPYFELEDTKGNRVNLNQFKQQWLVLYFYPKDDTPGCTKEACHFRDDMHHLEKLGAKVAGVSVDSKQSHTDFASKYALPFPLLADTQGTVADAYGALTKIGPVKMAKRYTFLIGPDSNIAKTYFNVEASTHSQQIIDDLTQLKAQN
ncbi:MAG: peroxiredoxin [Methylophilaceae bacterium 17-43-7]|nr:MAG: peroxiredoxin [Methylophilales bacterium 28-44-11]OYZ69207.1 MAG: peroxiredoxin [Methylophilaceae bacterium 17-43-7]